LPATSGRLLVPSVPVSIGLFALAGLAAGPVAPMIMVVGGDRYPDRSAAVGGYLTTAAVVGTIGFPTLMGFLSVTVGLQVAMLADMRFAAGDSQFGIPAAKLGIAYGYDGLRHLVSLVGPSWARLIMYTGMKIDAAEAVRIGLVERVLPDAELWDATMEIARTISGNAPLAIKAAKITIAQVLKDESQRDMEAVRQIGIACMDSEDFREGRTAFMDKRKPRFHGR